MQKLIVSNPEERLVADELKKIDDIIINFRGLIRSGEEINQHHLEQLTK